MNDLISYQLLKRQLVWDMVDHTQIPTPQAQQFFNLAPASLDVLTLEHNDSDTRLMAVSPLFPRIQTLCAVATEIAQQAILNYYDDDAEDTKEPGETLPFITTQIVIAVIADLMHKGMLQKGPTDG